MRQLIMWMVLLLGTSFCAGEFGIYNQYLNVACNTEGSFLNTFGELDNIPYEYHPNNRNVTMYGSCQVSGNEFECIDISVDSTPVNYNCNFPTHNHQFVFFIQFDDSSCNNFSYAGAANVNNNPIYNQSYIDAQLCSLLNESRPCENSQIYFCDSFRSGMEYIINHYGLPITMPPEPSGDDKDNDDDDLALPLGLGLGLGLPFVGLAAWLGYRRTRRGSTTADMVERFL